MGKKSAGGLLGSLIVAGVALGVAKYLKDYAGVKFTDDEQIDKVKNDSGAVKEAAKRTYIAIKEKTNVMENASELSKAAGAVVTDAADIVKTAGNETVNAFRDIKSRYDEDPDGVKAEITENISDMTAELARSAQDKTGEFIDRIRSAYEEDEPDETEYCTAASDDHEEGPSAGLSDESAKGDSENDGTSENAAANNGTAEMNAEVTEDNGSGAVTETEAEGDAAAEIRAEDDGSFRLHYEDDDNDSNVTITDDVE